MPNINFQYTHSEKRVKTFNFKEPGFLKSLTCGNQTELKKSSSILGINNINKSGEEGLNKDEDILHSGNKHDELLLPSYFGSNKKF
jgi:hypothetical protein